MSISVHWEGNVIQKERFEFQEINQIFALVTETWAAKLNSQNDYCLATRPIVDRKAGILIGKIQIFGKLL